MIHQVMVLFDAKARAFWTPFCCSHAEVGVRSVQGASLKAGTALCDHASDFTLYHIGTFNDELGQYEMFPQHINLGLVSSLRGKLRDSMPRSQELEELREAFGADQVFHTKGGN